MQPNGCIVTPSPQAPAAPHGGDGPGSTFTTLSDINDSGEIVGTYIDGSTRQFRGFIEKDGMFTSFDAPGGNRTFPSGVNNRGQIVGGIQIDRIPVGSFLATPSEN